MAGGRFIVLFSLLLCVCAVHGFGMDEEDTSLLASAASERASFFFGGSEEETPEQMKKRLADKFPDLLGPGVDHSFKAPNLELNTEGEPVDCRAPCPCMNTLANHGYLPRDGRDISQEMAAAVIMFKMGLTEKAAMAGASVFAKIGFQISNGRPKSTTDSLKQMVGFGDGKSYSDFKATLCDLTHDTRTDKPQGGEHPASLSRPDRVQGAGPFKAGQPNPVMMKPDQERFDRLFGKFKGKDITLNDFSAIRTLIVAEAKKNGYELTTQDKLPGAVESIIALRNLGGRRGQTEGKISYEQLKTWMLDQTIPKDYEEPVGIGVADLLSDAVSIKAMQVTTSVKDMIGGVFDLYNPNDK